MFNYSKDGITVATVLDKRRQAADGNWPVRIRVTRAQIRKYYSTGVTCSEETWVKLSSAKSKTHIEMRNDIENSFNIIKSHVHVLQSGDNFSFDNLKKSLLRISGESINVLLEQKINELRKNKQIGTMESYRNTLTNVERFKGKHIPVENVTTEWLQAFHKFLSESAGLALATIGINMRNLRAIMNIAKKEGLIKDSLYPFGAGKYEIRAVEGTKKALSLKQIKQIAEFKGQSKELRMSRDLWMFIYFCNGINIADLLTLKYSNIVDGEICFIRKKTERTTKKVVKIRAFINEEMDDIIQRWGNSPEPDNYIFPLIKHSDDPIVFQKRKKTFTKNFNVNMKYIGASLGIWDVTSYSARHSFATVLKRKGANVAYISESLGHTSLDTTQSYLDSFEKEEREKAAKMLNSFRDNK